MLVQVPLGGLKKMTEATKRPWYATGIHVQSAAINEDNYVCTAEGDTPETAVANADLIVNAVNSHDALVAALEQATEHVFACVLTDCIPCSKWKGEVGAALEAAE